MSSRHGQERKEPGLRMWANTIPSWWRSERSTKLKGQCYADRQKRMSSYSGFDRGTGRKYANWHQLTGTLSEVLGRPRTDFDVLRNDPLRSQRVARGQLRLLDIPGLRHLSR